MEEFLTPQEIATRWRVNAYTIRRWIATGALAAETIKEGKRNRHWLRKSLIEALEKSTSPSMLKHALYANSQRVNFLCLLISG
jgi:predicted site-specific integrase-resolvase